VSSVNFNTNPEVSPTIRTPKFNVTFGGRNTGIITMGSNNIITINGNRVANPSGLTILTTDNFTTDCQPKNIFFYDLKDISKLKVTSCNSNIKISQNESNDKLIIKCSNKPELQSKVLEIKNDDNISLKLPKINKTSNLLLDIYATNGNIQTTKDYKISFGGKISAINGNICLNIDRNYVTISECYVSCGSNKQTGQPSSNLKETSSLKLRTTCGNIAVNYC
jgi:hypothetical protein